MFKFRIKKSHKMSYEELRKHQQYEEEMSAAEGDFDKQREIQRRYKKENKSGGDTFR